MGPRAIIIIILLLLISANHCEGSRSTGEIKNLILNGKDVCFIKETIVGDLNFKREGLDTISSKIVLHDCRILGEMDFGKLAFNKSVDIENTTFFKRLIFSNARFDDDVRFSKSTFKEDVYFDNSIFKKSSEFGFTVFNGFAHFSGAHFCKDASFSAANFDIVATFEQTNFDEGSSFSSAVFRKNANFLESEFKKGVLFDGAIFGNEFTIRGSKFNDTANFDGSNIINVAYLSDTDLKGNLSMSNIKAHRLYLQNIKFSDSSRVLLDRSEFDSLFVDWDIFKKYLVYNKYTYSALINNFRMQGDFDSADDCYYQMRKMDVKNANIFWDLVYGYGVKPLKALFCCCVIIIVAAIIYFVYYSYVKKIYELKAKKFGKFYAFFYALLDALVLSVSVFILIHSSEKDDPTPLKCLILLEALLGWIFLALFLASFIRNPLG